MTEGSTTRNRCPNWFCPFYASALLAPRHEMPSRILIGEKVGRLALEPGPSERQATPGPAHLMAYRASLERILRPNGTRGQARHQNAALGASAGTSNGSGGHAPEVSPMIYLVLARDCWISIQLPEGANGTLLPSAFTKGDENSVGQLLLWHVESLDAAITITITTHPSILPRDE